MRLIFQLKLMQEVGTFINPSAFPPRPHHHHRHAHHMHHHQYHQYREPEHHHPHHGVQLTFQWRGVQEVGRVNAGRTLAHFVQCPLPTDCIIITIIIMFIRFSQQTYAGLS